MLLIKQTLRRVEDLENIYLNDSEMQKVIDISAKIENKVRHASVHAAGIVITKDSLDDTSPIFIVIKNDSCQLNIR